MNSQLSPEKKIKILLIENDIKYKDLVPKLREKHPDMNISKVHLSRALNGHYPSMLDKIEKVILPLIKNKKRGK